MRISAVLLALLLAGCARIEAWRAPTEPPAALREALGRGINLSLWFTYRDYPSLAVHHPSPADLRQLAAAGLRNARITFDPAWLMGAGGQPDPARIAVLADATRQVQAAGLLPVLALYPTGEWRKGLVADEATLVRSVAVWRALAETLAGLESSQVAFELVNEPGELSPGRWAELMTRLATAVREVSPARTLILGAPGYSDIPDLLRLKPLALGNVVYTFHFYEPKNFTHQGADWGWPMWRQFHQWPYPSSPETVAPLLAQHSPEAQDHLRHHGELRWNREGLRERLAQAAAWGRSQRQTVWCGEFGAHRAQVPTASREAWLRDVRESLEAEGLGWAMWDYAGHFALATGAPGARQFDAVTLRALGL